MAKRIFHRIEIWNFLHESEVRRGKRRPLVVEAKADNGSVWTVLPKRVADELGLVVSRHVKVRFADGRSARKPLARGLCIRIADWPDREVITEALILGNRDRVLLGCEELERMELIADHKAGVLRPRPGTEHGITGEVE